MKKNQPQQAQWAVMRKGGITPIIITYSKDEAQKFINGHEDILFVAEVIQ